MEELEWLLVDTVEIMLGARSSTRGHIVVSKDFLQLFPRSNGIWGKVGKPAHGGWRQHDREIIFHDIGVSSSGADSSGVGLQPLCQVHSSFVGLDPSDLETTVPLKHLECPCKCQRPLGVVSAIVSGVATDEWLDS